MNTTQIPRRVCKLRRSKIVGEARINVLVCMANDVAGNALDSVDLLEPLLSRLPGTSRRRFDALTDLDAAMEAVYGQAAGYR